MLFSPDRPLFARLQVHFVFVLAVEVVESCPRSPPMSLVYVVKRSHSLGKVEAQECSALWCSRGLSRQMTWKFGIDLSSAIPSYSKLTMTFEVAG